MGFGFQAASPADSDAVVETITAAFFDDPVWSWAFPDPDRRAEQYRVWWEMFVVAAIDNQSALVTGPAAEAASIWVPPGADEMREEDEARVEPLLRELLGDEQAERVLVLNEGFEAHHPEGHFHYLSLLGTHPDHRGGGIGMKLLADRLAQLDELAEPALLESTNPANHERYGRQGFRPIDEWHAPEGGPPVAVMWRDPL
jgi:GNAT superfamily N-acetyltransferase